MTAFWWQQTERPWIFGLLIAPSAVTANGVIQGGVLAYLLSASRGCERGAGTTLMQWLALPTSLVFSLELRLRIFLCGGERGCLRVAGWPRC